MNLQARIETIFSGLSGTCRVSILCKILGLKCYSETPGSIRHVPLLRNGQSGYGNYHPQEGAGTSGLGKFRRVECCLCYGKIGWTYRWVQL